MSAAISHLGVGACVAHCHWPYSLVRKYRRPYTRILGVTHVTPFCRRGKHSTGPSSYGSWVHTYSKFCSRESVVLVCSHRAQVLTDRWIRSLSCYRNNDIQRIDSLGPVSVWRCRLIGEGILIIDITRSHHRYCFSGNPNTRNDGIYFETRPWSV